MESGDVLFIVLTLLAAIIGAIIGAIKADDEGEEVWAGAFMGGAFGLIVLYSFGLILLLFDPTIKK